MKIFLPVIAHKYKWKYKISEYHVVWGTPWFLMWSSHCKVAKFLLPLDIPRKCKIAHVKKKICVLKGLSAQVKIWFCVHERDALVMCNESSRVCYLLYLEWHASWHYSQAGTILWFIKRNECWNDQGSITINIEENLWKTVSWHGKEPHGRLCKFILYLIKYRIKAGEV